MTEDCTIFVFIQDRSGQIQAVFKQQLDDQWQVVTDLPPTEPFTTAPIYAISLDDTVHAFYGHRDSSIHELVLVDGVWHGELLYIYVSNGYAINDMIDREVPSTGGGLPKSHISAIIMDDRFFLQFADSSGSAFVLKDGKALPVGRMTEYGFREFNDAEGHGPKELKW